MHINFADRLHQYMACTASARHRVEAPSPPRKIGAALPLGRPQPRAGVTKRLAMAASVCLRVMAMFSLASGAMAQETMTVGVTTTGVPLTFVDTATQEPTGAMVDLAKAIAADNGMPVRFQIMSFPALIPALTSGRIGLISASMFVTDERKKIVDFSTPVYAFGETMFVADADPHDYKIEDLKDAVIGAQIGSTFARAAQNLGIFREVKLYESIADIMRDVKLGRLKAGFGDQPIVAYQLSQNPALGVHMIKGYQPIDKGIVALAVAKDNPQLLSRIEGSIGKFKEDGTLAKIFAKYGL